MSPTALVGWLMLALVVVAAAIAGVRALAVLRLYRAIRTRVEGIARLPFDPAKIPMLQSRFSRSAAAGAALIPRASQAQRDLSDAAGSFRGVPRAFSSLTSAVRELVAVLR